MTDSLDAARTRDIVRGAEEPVVTTREISPEDAVREMAEAGFLPDMPRELQPRNILLDAFRATQGPRRQAYGTPAKNFEDTARIFNAITGRDLTPLECVQFMVAAKLARLIKTPDHWDSLVDLGGYAWVWSEVAEAEP